MSKTTVWHCLTCGLPQTGWGNNPAPIGQDDHPEMQDREVCGDCNAMYVIAARLGRPVSGNLYSRRGTQIGTFGTLPAA